MMKAKWKKSVWFFIFYRKVLNKEGLTAIKSENLAYR